MEGEPLKGTTGGWGPGGRGGGGGVLRGGVGSGLRQSNLGTDGEMESHRPKPTSPCPQQPYLVQGKQEQRDGSRRG